MLKQIWNLIVSMDFASDTVSWNCCGRMMGVGFLGIIYLFRIVEYSFRLPGLTIYSLFRKMKFVT